jgi:RsiW-degrading membrane proteinase PrsW (M82 family)
MNLLSLVLSVIVPALLLLAYGLIKTQRRLSREGLWAGFVGGILVAVAVIAWEVALDWALPLQDLPPVAEAAGHAMLIAALPEEGLKYGALLLVIRRFIYPGDVPDVILASLSVALGFAVMEDAGYVISAASEGSAGGVVALVRSLSAVPVHAVCGLVMGALVGRAIWASHAAPHASQWWLVSALLLPLLIHGAYDFLLMLRQGEPDAVWTFQLLPLLMALSAAIAIVLCNRALRRAGGGDLPRTAAAAVLAYSCCSRAWCWCW